MTEAPLLLAIKDDTAHVTLEGDLDLDNAEALKSILSEALQANKPMLIDLENVSDCHTVALQIFIATFKSAEQKAVPVSCVGGELLFAPLWALAGVNHLLNQAAATHLSPTGQVDASTRDETEQ